MNSRQTTGLGLLIGLVVASVALTLGTASPARSSVDDDDEDKAEQRVVAERAFVENCLMCHGADMTSRQRLTPKQWSAEVEKMIGWGTPLPAERKTGLIAYLSETYPPTRAAAPVERITPEAALATDRQDAPATATSLLKADVTHGSALFTQHCVVCHGPEARGGAIGINLVAKPVLVREDEFRATLTHGRRRMPNFVAVIDPQGQADLLAYLRQKQ